MDFNALDISASALNAQRVRMDTIASNIANVNTTRKPDGTPGVYRRKDAILSTIDNNMASGIKVLEISEDTRTPLKKVYNPSHPDSGSDGYVDLPNVNIVTEMVNMISASRAYEANVTTINATKKMVTEALKI